MRSQTAITDYYMQDVWKEAIRALLTFGEMIEDERGSKVCELPNISLVTMNPKKSKIPDGYPLKENALLKYENAMLDKESHGFVYTYGNRLRKFFQRPKWDPVRQATIYVEDVDQIQEAINRLKKHDKSRRATCVTWSPHLDTINNEVPCMIMVDFKVRNDILRTTGVWRSHDMFGAYPANFIALRSISQYVAKELEVEAGPITTHSINGHIYEYDLEDARRIFKL